ncbi:MAG: M20/M25/M40 family metallo-hydrolase [Planctomycetes bacterium]|nr:M20/M25/M40 family metallo-hydrolase [Planctomycetota bacterium]
MKTRPPLRLLFGLLASAAVLPAQIDTITEARVREAVSWLADDARAGRDTPSQGLEDAAQWLAKRFEAAGLQQGTKGSWFHEYTLPGLRVDSREIELKLVRKHKDKETTLDLQPDVDVRLWRAADTASGETEATTVAQADDPVLQRLLGAESGRRPIVIEVPTDHPFWLGAAGARTMLGGRRAAARPIFLVKKGLFPELPTDGTEATWTATWKAPAPEKVEIPLKNVVGMIPGTTKRDEYVIVSAHYDHIGTGSPAEGDSINNGADDDASGTTAVLLLAEALAREKPPARNILFVCFSGEEKGLRGSAAFAEHPPVPREQIVANINIEMIGRPEEGKQGMAWITGADLSDFAAIAGDALQLQGVALTEFRMAGQLFAQSDNYSFAKYGIVAHSLSAGSLHKDYHRPSDEVAKLDIPHMTKITRGLFEVVRAFADREPKPVWSEAGKKRIERLRK